jgi:putative transposase
LRNKNIDVLAAGGTQNHVHLLLRIPPMRPVSESIRNLKDNSSRYMSETSGHFAWQDGYAAISVSPSQVDAVRACTDGQKQHHEKHTYEREITALLDNRASRTSASICCNAAADAAQAIYGTPTRR